MHGKHELRAVHTILKHDNDLQSHRKHSTEDLVRSHAVHHRNLRHCHDAGSTKEASTLLDSLSDAGVLVHQLVRVRRLSVLHLPVE